MTENAAQQKRRMNNERKMVKLEMVNLHVDRTILAVNTIFKFFIQLLLPVDAYSKLEIKHWS